MHLFSLHSGSPTAIVKGNRVGVFVNPAIGPRLIQWFNQLAAPRQELRPPGPQDGSRHPAEGGRGSAHRLFGWPTPTLPPPPPGWKPGYMDMIPSRVLRAAYKEGIPAGRAHKIADYVYNYSLSQYNLENRLLGAAGHNASDQEFGGMDPVELVKDIRARIAPLAAQEHRRLMANGYRM